MPSRNCNTRPVSWKRSCNEQLANAVKEAQIKSHKLGWIVDECHLGILTSRDNLGRMEGSKNQLRDWFFPLFDNVMPDEVEEAIKLLHKHGLIIHYQIKGLWYIQLPKIGKWSEIIGNMADTSDFPAPSPKEIEDWELKFNDVYTLSERSIYLVSPEGKVEGKVEGKGKGKDKDKDYNTYVAFEKATHTLWNSFVFKYPILPKIEKIGETRRKHLKRRFESEHFRENFGKVLEEIPQSKFLLGTNNHNWCISFDWLIVNDNNYLKVLEGKYRDNKDDFKFKWMKKE